MNIASHFEPSRRSQKARLSRTLRALHLAPEIVPYASLVNFRPITAAAAKPRLTAREVAAGLLLLSRGFSGADALAAVLAGRAFLASFPIAGGR